MKAVTYDTFGEPADVLRASDIDRPEPGEGQILVRTILSPIHNHDLWTARGTYGHKPDLPATGGTEGVGTVEAVGKGVDDAMIGKRVATAGTGTWAEYFLADAGSAIPLPDDIPDEVGAQLIAMPFSALTLLEFLNVSEGDFVIQTAANGTVGKLMNDLAPTRGIKLVSLVRREEAKKEMRDLGAEHVVSTDDDDWQDQVRRIVGEDGARAAIDSVGGKIVADIADLLGRDGLLVVFGTATGEPLRLNAGPMISHHLVVRGFWASRIISDMADDEKARLMGEIVGLASEGKLDLSSAGEYALDDIGEAVKASLTPGRDGKVLMKP